jgi:YHS domain-containing protein
VPLPRATVPKPPQPMPPDEENLPLPEGRIAPPEGLMLPPGNGQLEPPLEPSLENPALPLRENLLPGLQPPGPAEKTPPPAPQLPPQEPASPQTAPPPSNGAAKPAEKPAQIPVEKPAEKPAPTPAAKSSSNATPKPKAETPAKPAAKAMTDAPLQPVGGMEPERRKSLTNVNRADPISLVIPEQHPERAQPAGYFAEEGAGTAEAGDEEYVPPVALGGYCPVELSVNGRWTPGDVRWTVVHKGKIYRLSGDRQRRDFLANPNRYAPAHGGNDPVSLVEEGRTAPGRVEYCAVYEGRLYMFSSAENQARFNQNPQRYAAGR